MSITTKPYKASKFEYFQLFMGYYLKRSWWMILIFIGFGLWNIYKYEAYFVASIILIFLILFVFVIWRRLGAAANKTVFSAEFFHFENGVITANLQNKQKTKFPINRILNIVKEKNYYLLFVNKSAFYYLHESVFQSAEDFAQFEKMINEKE